MARRMATRGHPSSTREEFGSELFPEPQFQEDHIENYRVLTQVDGDCRPQLDNPSSHLPDDDDDCALKEFLASQEQINKREQEEFKDDLEKELELELDVSDDEEEDVNGNNTNSTCTQNALDAASILVGDFSHRHIAIDSERPMPGLLRQRDKDAPEEEADDQLHAQQMREELANANNTTNINNTSSAAPLPSVDNDDDDNLASKLASFSRKHGLIGLNEEEKEHVNTCKEGKNISKCEAKQNSLEKQFFDTILEHGGHLKILATDVKPNKHHLSEANAMDKRFYSVCGGSKNQAKHKLVNDCFALCAMKWQCQSGKNKGKSLQPSSFNKHMEQLHIVLEAKGTQHSFSEDFNNAGEFYGVLKKKWKDIRKVDPSFGTGSNRARADKELFQKVVQAAKDGKI